MSAVADIFAAVRLDLQTGQFEVDATKLAGSVGDSMSKQLSSKLKSAIGPAMGASIGAAVGQLMQSTVPFAEFQKRMNEVFTLLPDASQSAMDQMTEDVKAFARETGNTTDQVIPALYQAISAGVPPENVFDFLRTANETAVGGVTSLQTAVDGLSSVVNAYGSDVLSVEKASDILFTGVRLGKTTIEELSKSLFQVVPTAAALGIGLDEVTAALTVMTGQGVPTTVATTQLRQAIVELSKEGSTTSAMFEKLAGKTFKEFIAAGGTLQGALDLMAGSAKTTGKGVNDLFSSVEAGNAALALTGKGAATFTANLDEMGKSGGATTKAFERMDSGLDATARKFAATMETMGIELGAFMSKFGPLPLIIASTFGPGLTRAMGAALGGLGALIIPKITGALVGAAGIEAWMTTGTKIGTLMGAAIGPAMAIAGVAAVVAAWAIINDQLNQQAAGLSTRLSEVVSTQTLEQLKQDKLAIGKAYADIANMPFGTLLYGDQLASLQRDLDVTNAAIAERLKTGSIGAGSEFGKGLTESVAAAITQGTPSAAMAADVFASMVGGAAKRSVRVGADQVVSVFGTTLVAGVKNAARATGIEGMLALAAGISSARQAPLDAFDAMVEMLKTPMTSTQEAARLAGELTSQSLADGLRSHDPEIRAQAIAVKRSILDRLEELRTAKGIGSAAMAELVKGMDSKDSEIRAAATTAYNAVMGKLNATKDAAGTAGENAGTAFASGLLSKLPSWLIARGVHQAGPEGRASGGQVDAGIPYLINERTARSEIFVADVPGRILTSVPGALTIAGGGSQTIEVPVYLDGAVIARVVSKHQADDYRR